MSASLPPIDRIIFGDNQFFGINHMSQDKAQERAERFAKLENVMAVYDHAIEAGIDAIMLNSNDRARGICDAFRADPAKYSHLKWYPSIPYPHKYAAMVNDKGMVGAVQEILFNKGAKSALGKMVRGASAVATLDAVKLMKMLIDEEMAIYDGLDDLSHLVHLAALSRDRFEQEVLHPVGFIADLLGARRHLAGIARQVGEESADLFQ